MAPRFKLERTPLDFVARHTFEQAANLKAQKLKNVPRDSTEAFNNYHFSQYAPILNEDETYNMLAAVEQMNQRVRIAQMINHAAAPGGVPPHAVPVPPAGLRGVLAGAQAHVQRAAEVGQRAVLQAQLADAEARRAQEAMGQEAERDELAQQPRDAWNLRGHIHRGWLRAHRARRLAGAFAQEMQARAAAVGQGALAVGQGAANAIGDGAFRVGQEARRLADQIANDLPDDFQSAEDEARPVRQPRGFGMQQAAVGAPRPDPIALGGPMPRAPLALGPPDAASGPDLSRSVWAQGGNVANNELFRIRDDPVALENAAAMTRAYAEQLRAEADMDWPNSNPGRLAALENLGRWATAIAETRAARRRIRPRGVP